MRERQIGPMIEELPAGRPEMPDKPSKEDSRRVWERVLSSIPHGLKVKTISVTAADEKRAASLSEPMEAPPETPTPGPVGPE